MSLGRLALNLSHSNPLAICEILESRTLFSAGDLDSTFGSGGKIFSILQTSGGQNLMAIQTDNKIVVVGQAPAGGFGVERVNADGTPDTNFDKKAAKKEVSFGHSDDQASAVAIQPSTGAIIVAGSGGGNFELESYKSNGTLDKTFGVKGSINTAMGASAQVRTIAIQSDGKILVGGSADGEFAVVRYNKNGTLDTSFGQNGKWTSTLGQDVTAVAIQADGKILLTGDDGFTHGGFYTARLNSNGSLDTNFGSGGSVVTTHVAQFDSYGYPIFDYQMLHPTSMAVQPNGQILVFGKSRSEPTGRFGATVVRYNSDGSIDSSFGNLGVAFDGFDDDYQFDAGSITLQRDGKIVFDGDYFEPSQLQNIVVGRFNSDGTLDFSNLVDLGTTPNSSSEGGNAIGMQSNGEIIVGGWHDGERSSGLGLALSRYLNDGGSVFSNTDNHLSRGRG